MTRRASAEVLLQTRGALEACRWLEARRLDVDKSWHVEVAIDVVDGPASLTYADHDTRFHLNIYREEWGVFFCHGSRASWIRVTDQPFVHGRDDFQLLAEITELDRAAALLRALEVRYAVGFRREHALIRTNVGKAKSAVREWLATF